MSKVTVRQMAEVLGMPVEKLISQFAEAGVDILEADAAVSNEDKRTLLGFLRSSHGKAGNEEAVPQKVTLKRKSHTEIRLPSGGRGPVKTVNVEVRKRRTYLKRGAGEAVSGEESERETAARELERAREEREQMERDAQALREKARQEAEERAQREAAELAAREAEARERRAREEEARLRSAEQAKAAEQERAAKARGEQEAKARRQKSAAEPAAGKTRYGREELHVAAGSAKRRKSAKVRRAPPVTAAGEHGFQKPAAPVKRSIEVPESITVGDLAKALAIKAPELIKALMGLGTMATINQALDQDTAILAAQELGHEARPAQAEDVEQRLLAAITGPEEGVAVKPRPPVVTVMGHVDHGKTSLLDYLRQSRVAAGESGGITQHIGAYHVQTARGGVTFLDTPGHAAFTAMRARGAQATDIVILVVAADDGVMPQTREAIAHARAAEVPLIVAINKIDKPEADPDRIKNDLAKEDVIPEEWGGNEQFVEVSAKTGAGIDRLLEAISVQAEVMELRAAAECAARGLVIESSLDKGRGPVATVLVQHGTLKEGDLVLAGHYFGRVRAMFNESGSRIKQAGPAMPALILGLSGVPAAGDDMQVIADEKIAREIADLREARQREGRLATQQGAKLDQLFEQMGGEEQKAVNLVLKADVQGSVEALRDALIKLSTDDVKVAVIASGVGAINESDASLAQASNAILIGFNVRADAVARRLIQENDLDVHYYSIIYNVIDEVKKAISGKLGTEVHEQILGLAEVREVFRSSRFGAVAGCLVVEGIVKRHNPIRVLRDNVVVFEGELESLRRFKDDVNEVQSGTECGIAVKQYNDVRPGDQIECFERIEVARTL